MKVLVVGGGGREHALCWALAKSPLVQRLYAAPGNAGTVPLAETVAIAADDVPALADFAQANAIDLTVVGPEAPLVAGLVDDLEARGLVAFGPTAAGARLEGSKSWTRELCERHGIPSPRYRTFTDHRGAAAHLDGLRPPYVVKADGLAAGKGVTVAADRATAEEALLDCFVRGAFGDAGRTVVIEEFLEGQELSALGITDGSRVLPLALARDYKRAHDRDRGPNTGGMGAFSPLPFVDHELESQIAKEILEATVAALEADGVRYRGVLYAGIMLTADGPKVLEFNARFGDPETQVILPRMDFDLAEILLAAAKGDLGDLGTAWKDRACVGVVVASAGYPGSIRTGAEVRGLDDAAAVEGAEVFHAGTVARDGRVVTAGGRVFTVSAIGSDHEEARRRAYQASSRIRFDGAWSRTDIARSVSTITGGSQ